MGFVGFFNVYISLALYVKTVGTKNDARDFHNLYLTVANAGDDLEDWTDFTKKLIDWVAQMDGSVIIKA